MIVANSYLISRGKKKKRDTDKNKALFANTSNSVWVHSISPFLTKTHPDKADFLDLAQHHLVQ